MARRMSLPSSVVTSRSLPIRNLRANGLKATKATPSSRQACSPATSGLRVHSEYSVCSVVMGCTACARRSVAADTSLRPIVRSLYFCVCVSVANQRSTWLSHDAEVGVK